MKLKDFTPIYQAWDIKAEVAAADLVENGAQIDAIVINAQGVFARKFRRDILGFREGESQTPGADSLLFIDVSREGIVDALPQGLFYQPERNSSGELRDKIDLLKIQHEEEQENRKFFSVFEKEFNACKILVELEERKSIAGMSEGFNSDLFMEIWPELQAVNEKFHKHLFQILPLTHKCRGNIELSAALLGFVLNEKVEMKADHMPVFNRNPVPTNELNKRYLGTDFILGDTTPDYEARYEVKVGPIERKKLKNYFFDGENYKVILFLMDYFIPVEAEYEIKILIEKESNSLFLRDSENYCYLGIDTKL